MHRIKFINKHLENYRLHLLFVIIVTILYAGINLIASLVFSFVIDNIIDSKPISNRMIGFLASIMGGVDDLKNNLWKVAILLIVVYLMVAILMHYRQKMQGIVSENIVESIRNELYSHIQKLPYSYHVKVKTGELIQKCTSDVDMVRRFFSGQFAEIFYILATVLIALLILFNINFKLALFASLSLPFIFVYSYLFFRKIQKEFLKSDESEAVMSSVIQESLSGVRVVKAFNREEYEIAKFRKTNLEYKDITYNMILNLGYYWSSSYFFCLLGILSVVIAGVFAVRNGDLTIGNFIVFITYQSMILYPIRALGRILSDFGKLTVSLDRLIEICDTEAEDLKSGLKPSLKGDIEFKNVSFAYEDNVLVLKNLNFKISDGETVAIIGPTGSGKSSLIHLLSRLYDVSDGEILINNINIEDINKLYLRDNVGIVLQEPFLFSRSIISNLRIVKENADDQEIYNACRIASIHDVINSFDKGYDTIVGEKGVTLSGGQKQRLAIARTILKHTPILIFDDSLSAVDTETDAAIRIALKTLQNNVTTIIITGRVSSAKDCDKIIVLENGEISDIGKHDELIKRDGLYSRINKIQNEYELTGEVDYVE